MESLKHNQNYYKNSLSLAYLGDAVFTLMVRKYLIQNSDNKPNTLNKKANSVVCARAQAEFMQQLKPSLTQDEMDIVMRARNSHTNNKAKNSSLQEYNLATQFEALLGYWYLNNEQNKIDDMFINLVVVKL